MSYKIAIFDMDGTILNTLDDLRDSTNHFLRLYGMPERSLEEIRSFVGNGIHKLIERSVPTGTEFNLVEQIYQEFTPYYQLHCADKTKPYDGINEVIQTLKDKGIVTAVVSNKPSFGVKALCAECFPGLFDYQVGEQAGIRRKPCPDGVLQVLEESGIAQNEAVYIGDSEVDFQTAQNAGIDVLMVAWGFRGEAFLQQLGAKNIIHQVPELLKYFD